MTVPFLQDGTRNYKEALELKVDLEGRVLLHSTDPGHTSYLLSAEGAADLSDDLLKMVAVGRMLEKGSVPKDVQDNPDDPSPLKALKRELGNLMGRMLGGASNETRHCGEALKAILEKYKETR